MLVSSEKYSCHHYNVNGLLTKDLTKTVTQEDEVAILGGQDKSCKSLPTVAQEVNKKCLILQNFKKQRCRHVI